MLVVLFVGVTSASEDSDGADHELARCTYFVYKTLPVDLLAEFPVPTNDFETQTLCEGVKEYIPCMKEYVKKRTGSRDTPERYARRMQNMYNFLDEYREEHCANFHTRSKLRETIKCLTNKDAKNAMKTAAFYTNNLSLRMAKKAGFHGYCCALMKSLEDKAILLPLYCHKDAAKTALSLLKDFVSKTYLAFVFYHGPLGLKWV